MQKIKQLKPGKYIIAVSGGVDSVALLDSLHHQNTASRDGACKLVVAHFDHGIRSSSAEDATFVRELARSYGLEFECGEATLGVGASEEAARMSRYIYLHEMALKHGATLVTAHHSDDVLETIIINITRGTGWRGLCSLRDKSGIRRPLIGTSKADVLKYAVSRKLQWREDETNRDTRYLRNHIRHTLMPKISWQSRRALLDLYNKQRLLREAFETELGVCVELIAPVSDGHYKRHPFIMADSYVALELLREVMIRRSGLAPTRPQLARALHAVKTARAGSRHNVGGGVGLLLAATSFVVE